MMMKNVRMTSNQAETNPNDKGGNEDPEIKRVVTDTIASVYSVNKHHVITVTPMDVIIFEPLVYNIT